MEEYHNKNIGLILLIIVRNMRCILKNQNIKPNKNGDLQLLNQIQALLNVSNSSLFHHLIVKKEIFQIQVAITHNSKPATEKTWQRRTM